MKNFLLIFLAALSIISCEDTQSNDVPLQAKVDDRLYRATEARAAVNGDGSLTIQGISNEESITIQLSRLGEGEFTIGEGRPNFAVYEDMGGSIYTTRPDGEGVVTISEVNETNKTISGIFNFHAFLPGVDTIYVSKGIMYNVSYTGSGIIDPTNAGTFRAEVNGNPFLPFLVSARSTNNSIIVSGSTANATISISVPTTVEVGIYNLPQGQFTAKYQSEAGPETTSEGIIEILAHDTASKTIKGSFSFITNRSEIAQGEFEVAY